MESRKDDIIIELGQQWVRIGLVSDKVPRKSIRSGALGSFDSNIPLIQYEIKVEEMLYTIFYSYLNTSCLNKSVILLEHVFTDRRITQAIAKILFKKFKIDKLQFSLSCITPLYLTGRFSGIVISAGSSAVEIMPVYESYPLFNYFKNIPTGGNAMIKLLKDEIVVNNPNAKPQVFAKLPDELLGDARNTHSNMNLIVEQGQQQQQKTISFMKHKLKIKPANITYKNIYGDPQNEEYNISYLFLEILEKLPPQYVQDICGNILLTGGLWKVKGMQNYFKKMVKKYLPKFDKVNKMNLAEKLKFVNWGFNPSQVSWAGCSVGVSVKPIEALCLKRVDYQKQGFTEKIMEAYFASG